MKSIAQKLIGIFFLCALPFLSDAQGLVKKTHDCSGFHRDFCAPSDIPEFKYNGQSRSALFALGETSELNVICYAGHDYRVSFCKEEVIQQDIHFKIKNKQDEVLYSNDQDDQYASEFEFSAGDRTKRLVLEVTIPKEDTQDSKLKSTSVACIGVLIEHMPSPDTGF